jgi:hypothetical protein
MYVSFLLQLTRGGGILYFNSIHSVLGIPLRKVFHFDTSQPIVFIQIYILLLTMDALIFYLLDLTGQ